MVELVNSEFLIKLVAAPLAIQQFAHSPINNFLYPGLRLVVSLTHLCYTNGAVVTAVSS
jgi:hypothetical protein